VRDGVDRGGWQEGAVGAFFGSFESGLKISRLRAGFLRSTEARWHWMQLAGLGDLKIGRMRLLKRSSGEGSAERAGEVPVTSITTVTVARKRAIA
jgi:hypothetical protein